MARRDTLCRVVSWETFIFLLLKHPGKIGMNIEKKTKIVATIGPATESEEMLTKLVYAGLNVMRLNFSHGDFAEHQKRVNNGRKVASKTGKPLAILQDLSGPKIRIGEFYQERVNLVPGEYITLTNEKIVGDEKRVYCNYENLAKEVQVGGFVLVDDGKKRFEIVDIKGNEVKCKIIVGGDTKGRRGVNLPGAYLKISCITDKDKKDLQFGIKNKVDFIALSFVRRPEDIKELRAMLDKANCKAGIIAKIETPEAVENIDSIIDLSDGIMVARGDLAIEIPAEKVPLVQKMIINKCNIAGRPVITATQMLESMIKLPVPTRAEVSDVANAIIDGTDAIMLSEETTLGSYPVEAVAVMSRVAQEVEGEYKRDTKLKGLEVHGKDITDDVSASAVTIARDVAAKVIVALTINGGSARMISRFKPSQSLIAFTPFKETYQRLLLSYGCYPVLMRKVSRLDDASKFIQETLRTKKVLKRGDKYVFVAGLPLGKNVPTNSLIVETL